MYRIRKIKFLNHAVLGNLELDFCGKDGRAVDTIILAGENGTGKSTIIDALYQVSSHSLNIPLVVELENDEKVFSITYSLRERPGKVPWIYANDGQGMSTIVGPDDLKNRYPFSGIFSDVDINFHADEVLNVTSLTLDATKTSRRSTEKLPTQINQLIVDIQSIDDSDLAHAYRVAKTSGCPTPEIVYQERMPRFTSAFNRMFEGLTYSRIENKDGKKSIVFQKNGVDIPINGLSSGEKQIVYRGCFLLKDVNATSGAFVFIDEPEISLHPNWQMKIMDYYKGIFTNKDGNQTSQIFAVTHSPFVIHNDNRRNDKVVILTRNQVGEIIIKDKPEYFKCNSVEAVQDAFSIHYFSESQSVVYLEGQTDEKYFRKVLEVYGYSVPFQFKWIGYIDEKGEEANTGKDALNKAVSFLMSRKFSIKNVFLYDCDTNKPTKDVNNVVTLCIPKFENAKGINVGIENALVFDNIDINPYKKQKITIDGYGIEKRIPDFQKMECCDYICSLDREMLKKVFINLKSVVERLISLLDKNDYVTPN